MDSRTLAPVPLRLIVGLRFPRPWLRQMIKGTDAFVSIVQAIGVPVPDLMAWATIVLELLCDWRCWSVLSYTW